MIINKQLYDINLRIILHHVTENSQSRIIQLKTKKAQDVFKHHLGFRLDFSIHDLNLFTNKTKKLIL